MYIKLFYVQFHGRKFLDDVSRLGVENPKEGLVGKVGDLLTYAVDVVNGVTFGQSEVGLHRSRAWLGKRSGEGGIEGSV